MGCHPDTEIESFRYGALSAEDTVLCAEHIEICSECSDRLDKVLAAESPRLISLDFWLRTFLKDAHLDDEELSDYLEGELDENEAKIIRIHLEVCARCYRDLLDLVEIRRLNKLELELRYRPPTRVGLIIEWIQMKVRKWLKLSRSVLCLLFNVTQ